MEYILLLKLDANLTFYVKKSNLDGELIKEQSGVINAQKEINKLQGASVGALREESARLFGLWKEENKLRHEAENKPQFGSWIAWTVAGVATLAGTGAIVYAVTK